MKNFKQFLQEVRYIEPDHKNRKNKEPIKDSETIRVFHGFNKLDDAVYTLTHGLSGKQKARRIYSYESGNNPKGLFVTIDFNIAEKFTSGKEKVIIEFSTKISDLEAPVWVGGRSYFIAGEYTKSFKDMDEREQQQLINRQIASDSPDPKISKSDRPELAQTIFDNPEHQALYIGDLNPNMIKRVWIKHNNTWYHMKPQQFLKKHKNHQYPEHLRSNYEKKYFQPSEIFTIQILYDKIAQELIKNKKSPDLNEIHNTIIDYITNFIFHPFYQSEYELTKLGFFPKQISTILQLYKNNTWKKELENIKPLTDQIENHLNSL